MCAFLECEAATQLAAHLAALSASAALLTAELGAAEHQAARAGEHAASLLLALQQPCLRRLPPRAAAADAADAAAAAARGATLRALLAKRADQRVADAFHLRLRRGAAPPPTPAADAAAAAPDAVAAGGRGGVREAARRRGDARDGGAAGGEGARVGRVADFVTELGDLDAAALDTPVRGAGGAAAAAAVDGGAAAHAAAQAAAGGERVVKAGALLKQGSLSNEFRERFCELVSLRDGGRSFLVYYAAAAPPARRRRRTSPYEAEAPKGV